MTLNTFSGKVDEAVFFYTTQIEPVDNVFAFQRAQALFFHVAEQTEM